MIEQVERVGYGDVLDVLVRVVGHIRQRITARAQRYSGNQRTASSLAVPNCGSRLRIRAGTTPVGQFQYPRNGASPYLG